jgi:hypothetical protein
MELVPADKLARVISLDYFGSFALLPVGFALASIVAPYAAPGTLMAAGQAIAGTTLLLGLLHPLVRRI